MGRAVSVSVAMLALAFSACGSDDEAAAPERPKLPPALAATLAAESDQIAENLAAGDECAADLQAQALLAHVEDAVGSGQVPSALGQEMSAAAGVLDDGIQCEPTPAPAPQPEPVETPTPCQQLEAQVAQLKDQAEQLKSEEGGQGSEEQKKQLEEQAKQVEEQLKAQCGEGDGGEGDGGDESVPPGQQKKGDSGRGNGQGGDD